MHASNVTRALLTSLALAVSFAAFAAPPKPFTATYQVSRQGQPMGEATITLKSLGNGEYEYAKQMQGTSGLAAMLKAHSSEVTRFRWHDNAPETETYASIVKAFKTKQRTMRVDWKSKDVHVEEGKDVIHYAAVPGLIDRNTLPYALGLALYNGSQSVTLPVGVKQRVEQQQFKVKGTKSVKVPVGSFQAERVTRADTDKDFEAWYVPKQYPLPVKLTQNEGGNLTLELAHFSSP